MQFQLPNCYTNKIRNIKVHGEDSFLKYCYVTMVVMKFPAFYGIKKDQQQVHKSLLPYPVLSHISLTFHKLVLENQLLYISPIHQL
jgi:hypothetical protein